MMMFMKKILIYIILASLCIACGTHSRIVFLKNSRWSVDQQRLLVSEAVRGMKFPMSVENLTSHSDSLFVITDKKMMKRNHEQTFVCSVLGQIPTKIDTVLFVIPQKVIVFESRRDSTWEPDNEIITRGRLKEYIGVFRNVIVSKKENRIICVDRMFTKGKLMGIAYVKAITSPSDTLGIRNPNRSLGTLMGIYKNVSVQILKNNLYYPDFLNE